jgi:hypothetical protein
MSYSFFKQFYIGKQAVESRDGESVHFSYAINLILSKLYSVFRAACSMISVDGCFRNLLRFTQAY